MTPCTSAANSAPMEVMDSLSCCPSGCLKSIQIQHSSKFNTNSPQKHPNSTQSTPNSFSSQLFSVNSPPSTYFTNKGSALLLLSSPSCPVFNSKLLIFTYYYSNFIYFSHYLILTCATDTSHPECSYTLPTSLLSDHH